MLRALQSNYLARAARIITPSFYLKQIIAGWGIREKVIDVIYNSVESDDHSVSLSGEQAPQIRPFDVVTVCRLVPWKGVGSLVRICGKRGWRLLVVGDGPERNKLETQASSFPHLVEFAGQIAQHKVREHLLRAKVFALNSSYEGLPHVVLEAKQAGIPIVATSEGGTPEAVSHDVDGRLVPFGDDGALEAELAAIISDAALAQRLVDAGRQRLSTEFSFENMARRTEEVLLRVAEEA
jgi:glycosyltransferase involved in cell wall biosynthesis